MKKVLLGILLCSTIVGVSPQKAVCSAEERDRLAEEKRRQKEIIEYLDPLLMLMRNAGSYKKPKLDLQCHEAIEKTREAIPLEEDFTKYFSQLIHYLCDANMEFSEDAQAIHAKLAQTLLQILENYESILGMRTQFFLPTESDPGAYSRALLRGLLRLPQNDFLKTFQTVLNVITFLENAPAGVFNASIAHLAQISPIFLCMIRHSYYTKRQQRQHITHRIAISSSPQDIQAAGAFFASLPNGALDRLIGKVERYNQENFDKFNEHEE
jgi:hypothetical protein